MSAAETPESSPPSLPSEGSTASPDESRTLRLPRRQNGPADLAAGKKRREQRAERLGGQPQQESQPESAGKGGHGGGRPGGNTSKRSDQYTDKYAEKHTDKYANKRPGKPAGGSERATGEHRRGPRPPRSEQPPRRPERPVSSAAPSSRPAPVSISAQLPTTLPDLPADSLALSLWLAAYAVAAVRLGLSLSEAQRLWRQAEASPTVRAGAQDLAYGALRRSEAGQFQLAQLLSKPLDEPVTHALLLCATYRLATRPDAAHTVVDQAVRAAACIAGGNFKGLVNGVLRNALRRADELAAALAADPIAPHQHPAWWLQRLQKAYPQDWPQIVAAGNGQPPLTLRVNGRRADRASLLARYAEADIAARPVGEDGIRLQTPRPVQELPGFAEGQVSVQDLGAQEAAQRLGALAGERILDACAAPGGKTAHVLERAAVSLLALDVDPLRCQRIQENLDRLHLTDPARVSVMAADCRAVDSWWDGQPFDRILADVPCSASGVVRRHPDAKWLRRPEDIAAFASTQRQIIDALWPLLKPGGSFLYATCSVFPAENGEQIDALLHRHGDAREVSRAQLLPGDEHDGFFYALLHKQG